jgi:hypothetical protein
MFCRPPGSLLASLEARDKIVGVTTHRVRGGGGGGGSGLVSFSRMVTRGARVTTVGCVTMCPAVATRAFA